MKLLVIGAGFLGQEILKVSLEEGIKAIGTTRKESSEFLTLDVVSKEGFTKLPRDINAIIYCVSASSGTEQGYRQAYVEGLQNILQYISSERSHFPDFTKFVFISSTGIYFQNKGEIVSEDTQIVPDNFRSNTLSEAENLLHKFLPTSSTLILRFSGIYGKGRNYLLNHALNMSDYSIQTDSWTNRIHRYDGAKAVIHLLQSSGIFNISDKEPASRIEVLQYIRSLYNKDPLKCALSSEEKAGKRCSSAKLQQTNFNFKYPTFKEGYLSYVI